MKPEGAQRSRRVVVTGLGAVTAAGWGVAPFLEAAEAGRTSIRPFDRFPNDRHRTHVAGQVPDPPPAARRLVQATRFSNADRFAIFAAAEALAQAGLAAPLRAYSVGVFFGSSTGGLFESESFFDQLVSRGPDADRGLVASHQLSAPAECVARHFGAAGPVETVSSACASAGLAIEQAMRSVASGEVDIALAGGSDSLAVTTYAGFNALRAMDEQPCRPFHAARAGMSLGEGGGVLVLESEEQARRRGAVVLAELAGAGSTCDASHMTAPHEAGIWAAAAMQAAIEDAGISPDDVDLVNAHATGTPLNDAAEFAAMRLVFGERASRIPVEATKSLLGHLLGAAGAVEAVATVLALHRFTVHPTPSSGDLDPATPVDLVRDRPRRVPGMRYAISSSLGFGGANAAVLFARGVAS